MTLTGITTLGESEPGSNGHKGYSKSPKAPGVESHDQKQFSLILKTLVEGWERGPTSSAEMQSAYFTAPGDKVICS